MANLDRLFLVTSVRDPGPEPLILDKTIAVAELAGIEPVLVVTKTDLEQAEALEEIYRLAGIRCVAVSSVTGQGWRRSAGCWRERSPPLQETPGWESPPC